MLLHFARVVVLLPLLLASFLNMLVHILHGKNSPLFNEIELDYKNIRNYIIIMDGMKVDAGHESSATFIPGC